MNLTNKSILCLLNWFLYYLLRLNWLLWAISLILRWLIVLHWNSFIFRSRLIDQVWVLYGCLSPVVNYKQRTWCLSSVLWCLSSVLRYILLHRWSWLCENNSWRSCWVLCGLNRSLVLSWILLLYRCLVCLSGILWGCCCLSRPKIISWRHCSVCLCCLILLNRRRSDIWRSRSRFWTSVRDIRFNPSFNSEPTGKDGCRDTSDIEISALQHAILLCRSYKALWPAAVNVVRSNINIDLRLSYLTNFQPHPVFDSHADWVFNDKSTNVSINKFISCAIPINVSSDLDSIQRWNNVFVSVIPTCWFIWTDHILKSKWNICYIIVFIRAITINATWTFFTLLTAIPVLEVRACTKHLLFIDTFHFALVWLGKIIIIGFIKTSFTYLRRNWLLNNFNLNKLIVLVNYSFVLA